MDYFEIYVCMTINKNSLSSKSEVMREFGQVLQPLIDANFWFPLNRINNLSFNELMSLKFIWYIDNQYNSGYIRKKEDTRPFEQEI